MSDSSPTYNISKTIVTPETAQAILASHMGNQTRIAAFEELKEGYFNAAYRVDLSDGLKCVLKVAPPPEVHILRYEHDILRAEVEVMRLVKMRTEMPVPAILFHDATCTILPSPYYLMEFIQGQPLHKLRASLSESEQAEIDRAMGRYLRQMNAIASPTFGYYAQVEPPLPTWRETFDRMLGGVLQDGLQAGDLFGVEIELPVPYEALHQLARRCYAALDEVQTPALVHWDLWDGNIFIAPTRAGPCIRGVIDFERSLWADPLMEVNFGAFGFNPHFLEGYGLELPLTPTQQVRRTLYNIYLFLIMVIECTYRRYPNHDQENWARGRLAQEIEQLAAHADRFQTRNP
jgi:aminoglycoside phosphotransferase (APT) family kinase protein